MPFAENDGAGIFDKWRFSPNLNNSSRKSDKKEKKDISLARDSMSPIMVIRIDKSVRVTIKIYLYTEFLIQPYDFLLDDCMDVY